MSTEFLHTALQITVMAIFMAVILLFLGVGMLVVVHVCIVGRAFRRGFRNPARLDSSNNSRDRNMSQDDLRKLPCYDFTAKDQGSSPVDCAVCLENFKMGEKCRLLPLCRHSFHADCVDSWLLRNPICPICRASADSGKDESLLEEESSLSSEGREDRDNQGNDVRIEVRGNQRREGNNVNDSSDESRENQGNLVGTRLSFAVETTAITL